MNKAVVVMPDVQGSADTRHIAIDKVGKIGRAHV